MIGNNLPKEAMIKQEKDGFHVLSESGKNLGGPYKTLRQATHRLNQVEYFKEKKSEEIFPEKKVNKPFLKRIKNLDDIIAIQKSEPSIKTDSYMQGLTNGLILAESIVKDKGINDKVDFIKLKKESSEVRKKDMELYNTWKVNPTPNTLSPLMKQIEPIVKNELNRWQQSTVNPDLLEMEAKNLAFSALKTFDPSKSQLNTHITNNLQRLSRFVINKQNMIRQPEEKIYNYRKYLQIKELLSEELGREPTDSEITEKLGHRGKIGDYKPIIENFYSIASETGNAPAMSELSSDSTTMSMMFDTLNDKHKYIFQHTFGYNNSPILSNKQIAKNMGVSEAAISKHKRKIEDKYKKYTQSMNSISF